MGKKKVLEALVMMWCDHLFRYSKRSCMGKLFQGQVFSERSEENHFYYGIGAVYCSCAL